MSTRTIVSHDNIELSNYIPIVDGGARSVASKIVSRLRYYDIGWYPIPSRRMGVHQASHWLNKNPWRTNRNSPCKKGVTKIPRIISVGIINSTYHVIRIWCTVLALFGMGIRKTKILLVARMERHGYQTDRTIGFYYTMPQWKRGVSCRLVNGRWCQLSSRNKGVCETERKYFQKVISLIIISILSLTWINIAM